MHTYDTCISTFVFMSWSAMRKRECLCVCVCVSTCECDSRDQQWKIMYVYICITDVSDCDCICYMISEQTVFLGYGGDCLALVYKDDNEPLLHYPICVLKSS